MLENPSSTSSLWATGSEFVEAVRFSRITFCLKGWSSLREPQLSDRSDGGGTL
jgi:hypothetical protein